MPRSTATACAVGVVIACLAGCSQNRDPTEPPGVTPPVLRGKPAVVDACALLPPEQASAIIAEPLSVVGTRIEPPRLETVRCDLGQRFGQPLVSVELTTDPIAYTVFDAAYGQAAGGDPQSVGSTKKPAIWRIQGNERRLRTFVHGAVVSVETNDDLAPPLDRRVMVELSRLAVSRLPDNPVLRERGKLDRCASMSESVVGLALGRPPTLQAEFSVNGSVQCSWGGQPGSAVVTVSDDPRDVRRFAKIAPDVEQVKVNGVGPRDEVQAWSNTEVAGDLVVLSHDRVFSIEVTPAEGFSDPEITTTSPELALARDAVSSLR